MFLGQHQHNLDSKGRLAVPAKFRDKLKGESIITRGLDSCLFLFPMEEWEILAKKLINLPLAQSDSRAFSRLMLAGASEVQIDKQGRILIPDYLRKYAQLRKEIIIAGLYNRVEIWDKDRWIEYKNKTENSSDKIAERLSELGI